METDTSVDWPEYNTGRELSERPRWLTDELVEVMLDTYRPKTTEQFDESDAVELLCSLSQLLEVTGILKLENDDE